MGELTIVTIITALALFLLLLIDVIFGVVYQCEALFFYAFDYFVRVQTCLKEDSEDLFIFRSKARVGKYE